MFNFNKKILFIAAAFALLSVNVFADSFTASASSTTVGEGDQFEVSFTFSGGDINGIRGFTPPVFKDFLTLSGPNQSTSMQIINGAVSGSISYTYYLQPRSIGKFIIGSASVTYKGNTFKTEPLKIEVVKGSPRPKQNSNQNNDVVSADRNDEIAKNCFVRAIPDKQKVYQGEQVTVTYKLYTRLNIASQMSVSKLPQYQGFWSEELETSSNITFTTETYEGKQFRVGILKRAALFPTQSGELSVTPFELKVPVQIQKKRKTGNSIFDDFFNDPFFGVGETVEFTAKSNTIKINVLPLPEKNKPASFQGAVGQYTMNAQFDKTSTKTNEPVSLKMTIDGSGNIQLLNIPEIQLPTGLEKFEPKTDEQVNRSNRVNGTKKIEYLLVPRTPGKKEIPPINFSYFDPSKGAYVTLSTPTYTLNVEQGAVASGQDYSKEEVKLLNDDIRYIKTDVSLNQKGNLAINSFGFWTATALPLMALIGLVAWKRKEQKLYADINALKYQKARKIAVKRLKTAKAMMLQNKREEFYTEISAALFGYLEDKLHIAKAEFTLEGAAIELRQRDVSEELIADLVSCAEKCEFVRFAPSHDQGTEMKEMYGRSEDIIIQLENSMVRRKNA